MNTSTGCSHLSNEQLLASIAYGQKLIDEGWLSMQAVEALESLAGPPALMAPQDFRRKLLIDAGGTLKPLEDSLDEWQREDFAALDASWWRMVTGQGDGKQYGYFERPRGHSKSTDFGSMAAWAIYASPRPLNGFVIATDREQAQIIRNIIKGFSLQNPWFDAVVDVHNYEVKNRATGSLMKIVAADAASAYGEIPDFMILDELTHWKNDGMWQTSFSSVPKKANCLLQIATNAGVGMGESWQWKVREMAHTDPDWHFSRLDRPRASWQSPAALAKQEIGLPPKAYKRLWLNQWQVESGDCLEHKDVQAAIVANCQPMLEHDGHFDFYCAGLDLSYRRHHSALVIVATRPSENKIRLVHVKSWNPADHGGELNLTMIEDYVFAACKRFKVESVWSDHWNPQLMQNLCLRAEKPGSGILSGFSAHAQHTTRARDGDMAHAIVRMFKEQRFEMWNDPLLVADLLKLNIEDTGHGVRINPPEDEHGHCDRAMALAQCLPVAVKVLDATRANHEKRA